VTGHGSAVKTQMALAALAALLAASLAAQLPAASGSAKPQRPTFRTGTNYVRVDVYVTLDGRTVADLKPGDFALREDGVEQKLDSVEFVDPGPPVPEDVRVEPNTAQQSFDAATDPRARLFVIFIDTYHLHWTSGFRAHQAFVQMLGQNIGERDLVAVMTPEMSAASIAFGRRTQVIEDLLQRHFDTTRTLNPLDEDDNWYIACYGLYPDIAQQMIERRHEKLALDALRDLSRFLGALRDERKAVFMVSDGWVPTRPSEALARPLSDGQSPAAPAPPKIGTGPDGRLRPGTGRDKQQGGSDRFACDNDRMSLAREDHEAEFRQMLDTANRESVSFYPVDLRGLTVSDPPGREMLQNMASATDGLAIVDENDAAAGVRRAMDDMRGYYLLGYYSSNAKADGRFRSIKIDVKRPRVRVRARRGYLAPSEAELKAIAAAEESRTAGGGRAAAADAGGGSAPAPGAVTNALVALARIPRAAAVRSLAGYGWQAVPDGAPRAAIWIAGEFDAVVAATDERWEDGGQVAIQLEGPGGAAIEKQTQAIDRDSRFFLVRFAGATGLAPGDYTVRLTARPEGATLATTEILTVSVPTSKPGGAGLIAQPQLFRRGPFSGPGWMPTGDLRYHRQERVKVQTAVMGEVTSSSVKLLDRAGHPLPLPMTAGAAPEAGITTVSGEVALAPLGAGDYVVETTITRGSTTERRYTAIRIVP
jgi:VWFA-related protein